MALSSKNAVLRLIQAGTVFVQLAQALIKKRYLGVMDICAKSPSPLKFFYRDWMISSFAIFISVLWSRSGPVVDGPTVAEA